MIESFQSERKRDERTRKGRKLNDQTISQTLPDSDNEHIRLYRESGKVIKLQQYLLCD